MTRRPDLAFLIALAVTAAAAAPAATSAPAYEVALDTANLSPEMAAWTRAHLLPVCEAWYPRIVSMLPGDGFEAPRRFTVSFRTDMKETPAMASGDRVMCNAEWFTKNRDGEAIGSVIHEMVHVVQQYDGRRGNVPFWLQEGIPDYIRWYLYEPEKNGARIRDASKVKYDDAYRVSANFLDWATRTYDADLVRKLNARVRDGNYDDAIWPELTKGKTLDQLDVEWKRSLKTAKL